MLLAANAAGAAWSFVISAVLFALLTPGKALTFAIKSLISATAPLMCTLKQQVDLLWLSFLAHPGPKYRKRA